MKKLRVGVIGCGRISVRHFIPLTSIDDVELVACCDIKKDRADEAANKYGIKAYYSYEEMIKEEKLDAVHLCLPHYLHSTVAIFAFNHGVNVLSEKPMDIDMIFRIAAIGIIVAVLNQLLVRSGREEQAMMTTLAGLVVVMMMLVKEISALFTLIKSLFGF